METFTLSSAGPSVRRRRVLYLGGYDARGPVHYHQLYAEQAARQAAVAGHRLAVTPPTLDDPCRAHWQVHAEVEGQQVEVRYEYLRWEDLVRTYWPRSHQAYLRQALRFVWQGLREGSLLRMLRTSRGFFVCCIAAAAVTLTLALLGLAALVVGALAWRHGSPWAAAGALAVLGLLWPISRFFERRRMLGWLMRGIDCGARVGTGDLPELEQRLDHFAGHLLDVLNEQTDDEVLLVGHCLGTVLATAVAARALERQPQALQDRRFALLTLAPVYPLSSYPPRASAFRAALVRLAEALGPRWVDVSAPMDRCCTPMVDPTQAAQGLDGIASSACPKRVSPRWHQTFSAAAYASLCGDLNGIHFQYLRANELPGHYDYFAITGGPMRLHERFADWRDAGTVRALQFLGGPFPDLHRP